MDAPRRLAVALVAVAAVLLAHGYYLDAVVTIEQPQPGIARRPLYVAAATAGALAALGCAVGLFRDGDGPSIRDGIVLAAAITVATPLVTTLVDPEFHAVLVADPVDSIRGLGTTIATTPGAILGGSPGPALGALLAPTALLGIAVGRRAWQIAGASVALLFGVGLVLAGTGSSLWAPLAYVLLLAESVVVLGVVPVPGVGWMLALVPAIVGFVSVDAPRAIGGANGES